MLKGGTLLRVQGVLSRRAHSFKSKKCGQGRGFMLLECTKLSRRVLGEILNSEGSPIKASECAHALKMVKEGARRITRG